MLLRSFAAPTARLVLAGFAIFSLFTAAQAEQFLSFVSARGDDANSCFVQAKPCRTLQRAIDVTSAKGTVRILTDLKGDATVVAKSLTIEGDGYTVIGAIVINDASAVVALRNLALTGRGDEVNGVDIRSADEVHIEDCTVERYTGAGIKLVASTSTNLYLSGTVSRDNGSDGVWVNAASAEVTVENSRFENNIGDGLHLEAYRASVIRSVVSGNIHGIVVFGAANITETTVAGHNTGVWVKSGVAILASSVMSGNTTGLYVDDTSAEITDCVFALNYTGISNFGTLYTRKNNTLNWNVTDYSVGGGGTKITAGAF